MTISLQYQPVKVPWTGERVLDFDFECLGADAFEVWLETETEVVDTYSRVRISPQYYNVVFNGGKPTYVAGTVTLTGPIPDTVDRISIERNTLITQTCDLKNFAPFQMPTLEYMLDKLVMILQEIMANKCGVQFSIKPLQPYRFEPYTLLSSTVVNTALESAAYYMALIIDLGLDCLETPEAA